VQRQPKRHLLPVQAPTKLIVNLKTAKALGLDNSVFRTDAERHDDVFRNGSSGFDGNAGSAEVADLIARDLGERFIQHCLSIMTFKLMLITLNNADHVKQCRVQKMEFAFFD
jgi:hypothetical protein